MTRGQGGDAAGDPGVELGGPETVDGEDAVDAERAAVADRRPQVLSGTTGELAHPRPVGRPAGPRSCRGRRRRSGGPRPAGWRARPDAAPPCRRGGQAVDAARHALEERHHPHPVAAGGEERERRRGVLRVDDPAHEVAAAVEAVARVARPDHAGAPVEGDGARLERGGVDRHDVEPRACARRPRPRPRRRRACPRAPARRRAARRRPAAVDRLGGDERADQPQRLAARGRRRRGRDAPRRQACAPASWRAQLLGHRAPWPARPRRTTSACSAAGTGPAPTAGGDQQRPPGAGLLEQANHGHEAGQRRAAADHTSRSRNSSPRSVGATAPAGASSPRSIGRG